MAIVEQIIKAKGEHLLTAKENLKLILEKVRDYLTKTFWQQEIRIVVGYHMTVEKAHGTMETWKYYQTDDLK